MTIEPIAPYEPRVAIVTGAAQGLGRAIALRLADDGFNVAVDDLPEQEEKLNSLRTAIEEKGRRAMIVTADVSMEEEVMEMEKQQLPLDRDVERHTLRPPAPEPFLHHGFEHFCRT